ncbi:MAG: hypothetical protein IT422_12315 [Pirellulaceae bacterium]|jgi:hypothetical protein|nr:hypothetical protein [Pirellulaceae bacterium]
MRDGRTPLKLLIILALMWSASPAAIGQSQSEYSQITRVSGTRCQCGRWTCLDCQQQRLCEPCAPSQLTPQFGLPGTVLAPPVQPSPPGSTGSGSQSLSDSGRSPSDMAASPDSPNLSGESNNSSLAQPSTGPNTTDLFAANLGRGSEGAFGSSLRGATTPEMMGDFFGPGGSTSILIRDYEPLTQTVPNAGYALGRMKLAENSSPIPRDRIFFNYSHFTGVPLASQPISVNRYSPGFEKTFWDGLCSFEVRTPFGSSIDNDILTNGLTSDNQFQFGNMFFSLKGVLIHRENWLVTAGSSLLVPTAQDTRVIDPATREEYLRIDNESTHIMPFIGGAFIPSERLFAQWMVQCDIDANGNPVIATENSVQRQIGTLQDFTLLYTDLSIGYWLYQATGSQRRTVTGIAPVAELHYNRSLTSADSITDTSNQINQVITDFDNVNIQVGLIFNIRNNSRLGFGYATPLGNSFDRVFDKEFRVTLNRYY